MYQLQLYAWIALLLTAFALGLPEEDNRQTVNAVIEERAAIPSGYTARPYYPAPNGGWIASWNASYAKAAAVVRKMTLAEKVNLTSGTGYFMVCE